MTMSMRPTVTSQEEVKELPEIDPELEQIVADDLDRLQGLVEEERLTNADLRAASVALRNLLIYDQLQKVSSARGQSITIAVPDHRQVVPELQQNSNLRIFQMGGYIAFGAYYAGQIMNVGPRRLGESFHPDQMFDANLNAFKSQPVFVVRYIEHPARGFAPAITKSGTVSREAAIKYVANKTGATHYDKKRERDEDLLLDCARRATMIARLPEGGSVQNFDLRVFEDPNYRASKRPPGIGRLSQTELDPVALEMMGAAMMVMNSPSVQALRELLGT